MAQTRRSWTPYEVARLKELAGRCTVKEIAREIGRTEGAVAMEASKLKLSLSTKRRVSSENLQLGAF